MCLCGTVLVYLLLFVSLDVLNEGCKFMFIQLSVSLIFWSLYGLVLKKRCLLNNSNLLLETKKEVFIYPPKKRATWLICKPDRQRQCGK